MEDSTFAGRKHHLAHIGALFVRYDTEIDVLLLSKNSTFKNQLTHALHFYYVKRNLIFRKIKSLLQIIPLIWLYIRSS